MEGEAGEVLGEGKEDKGEGEENKGEDKKESKKGGIRVIFLL